MTILQHLQRSILPGEVLDVMVGLSRVAVLVRTQNGLSCGLAATLQNPEFNHRHRPAVREAGNLHKLSTTDLVEMVESDSLTEAAIGMAAINALLPPVSAPLEALNAHEYVLEHCQGKNVAFIGHFPFGDEIRKRAANYWVFELNPREDDLPSSAAPDYLPKTDILALSATTLINKTFEELVRLCKPGKEVVMLGPSTPMTPILFEYGVTILSGTIVLNARETMLSISQGASSHMVQEKGFARYVTLRKN